jgi:hypothetical protein
MPDVTAEPQRVEPSASARLTAGMAAMKRFPVSLTHLLTPRFRPVAASWLRSTAPGMVSGDRTETAAMERLRDRMARELRVRGMAERTVSAYVDDVRLLVERTDLHPARLSQADLKAYLDELLVERRVAPSRLRPARGGDALLLHPRRAARLPHPP